MYYYSNTVCVVLLGSDTNLYDITGYDSVICKQMAVFRYYYIKTAILQ